MRDMDPKLTHLNESGKVKMVDVSGKLPTTRMAVARGSVLMKQKTLALIIDKTIPKGDVFATAKIAGIMAAKRTSEIIPLCHPLQLSFISVDIEADANLPGLQLTASVKTNGQTGVEMEALTAVSVAALTVYDMVKAVDKSMMIGDITLVEKHGGKSGDYTRE